MSLLSTKLREAESEKEKYHEQLTAAEKRIDRLQSATVSSLNPSSRSPGGDAPRDEAQESLKSEKVEPTTPQRSPSVGVSIVCGRDYSYPTDRKPQTDTAVNGDIPSVDGEEISAVYRQQQEKYNEALQENAALNAELYKATAAVSDNGGYPHAKLLKSY